MRSEATIPGTPTNRCVPRPRLSARLEAKPWTRLALVSAPAGFGKSTAIDAWARSGPVACASIALGPADNDVVRFVRVVSGAIATLADGLSDGHPTAAERMPDEEATGAAIVEWLSAAADAHPDHRIALVLDDYHAIEEPRIHRLVGEVVNTLPPGCLVVIATRADPPIALARLRARDELVEVRAADLRFSVDEAGELLLLAGVELGPDDLQALLVRTEGWAAVLRLAAVALRGRPDVTQAVERFGASHRFVLDYVVEEVLAGLPERTVDFLLQTSILERLCGELCDAVTGGTDGQKMLEELERMNLLLLPLDDERRWYRYHALFAEILRRRRPPASDMDGAVLHDRASRWFEAHGLDEQAIGHALASGDPERAARLVADASLPRLNAGELATVRGWLDALGPEIVRGMAQLSLSSGWCLALWGDVDGAELAIGNAEAAHAAGSDGGRFSAPLIAAEMALLRSYVAGLRRDPVLAIAEASKALLLVPADLPPVVEATLRGDASVFLARALLISGETTRGFETYVGALPDLRAGQNVLAIGRALNDLVGASIERGDPATGLRLCTEEAELTPAIASAATYWGALAKAHEALDDPQAAVAATKRALEVALRTGDGQVATWARATEARLSGSGSNVEAPGGCNLRAQANRALVEPLTERELEVLRLVAEGRSNSQIGQELFVTVGTVKSHVHAISGKLGATNRVEAVALARRRRLID